MMLVMQQIHLQSETISLAVRIMDIYLMRNAQSVELAYL